MAKKCSIRSLSDNCVAELANMVVTTVGFASHISLDHDITITIVEVNDYLEREGATGDIYQNLLRVILDSDYLEASIRFTCLQMLLNGSVQSLSTEIFPFSYYEKILQVIAAQGTGLRSLNLKGVWVKEEHMHYMCEIIKKCKLLKKLHIPYIANDDLLEVISKHSANLKLLDISGETDITEIGVEYLSMGLARENLIAIDIGMLGEENICHTDIAVLLEHCPNLETLATYSYVGPALKFIYDNVDKNFKSKLRYLHDTKTTRNTLDAIVKTCPELQSVYLDTPEDGILELLKKTRLRRLKIYKFSCDELMNVLQIIGQNLIHLTIIKGRGNLQVGLLSNLCPNLIDLDCYMMDALSYNYEGRNKFEYLQGLEMLNSPMTEYELKHFICNTTTLQRLAIDTVNFNDEDINSMLLHHEFIFLEDVWFTSAPNLTIRAVHVLLENCPELQSIGQLSGWALTPDDLALLRGLLKSVNSCLVLSPSTLFP